MAGESHYFDTYPINESDNPRPLQVLFNHESLQGVTRYVHASNKYVEETRRKYHHQARLG